MPKKIILFNTLHQINQFGGMERVMCDLANYLDSKGFDVIIIHCDENNNKPAYKVNNNIAVINVFTRKNISLIDKFKCLSISKYKRHCGRAFARAKNIASGLKKLKWIFDSPDLFVCFQPESVYIVRKYISQKIPVIAMIHSKPSIYLNTIEFDIYKKYFSQSNYIQVLLPDFKKDVLIAQSNAKVIVIPNAVTDFKDACIRNKYQRENIITAVGRVTKEKNHIQLIKAFELIAMQHPDWRVEIWGSTEGAYAKKLIDYVEQNVILGGKVKFCGITNDIYSVLQRASIFVMPSLFEGFSLALIEAMSHGLPVIGRASCSGINGLIKNDINGFLVGDTAEDLSYKLSNLIDDFSLRERLGRNGISESSSFLHDNIYGEWVKLINDIIDDSQNKNVGL